MLPFSQGEFLAVFARYNEAIWPAQIFAYLLGIAAVLLLFVRSDAAGRLISLCLGAMWLWTGAVYHWFHFSRIDLPAYLFGAIFVTQGASFIVYGTIQGKTGYTFRRDIAGWAGLALIAYSAIGYPIVGWAAGETYPQMPVFGITPCPVTIFTFGMLVFARPIFSPWFLVIPFIWALIGGSAAFLLDMPQDWLLLPSGLIAMWALFMNRLPEAPAE